MSIKDYKGYFEDKKDDNLRDDEHAYLNDMINNRWDDSTYDDNDDYELQQRLDSDPGYKKLYDEEDDDDINQDDMEHLIYLLRTMFKNSGFDNVRIDNIKGLDITIYCTFETKDRLKNVVKAFEVVNKLKRDILSQYDSELDIWENRKGNPMLVFVFEYNEGLDDDSNVF